MRFKVSEMLFHFLDNLNVDEGICYKIIKGVPSLRNWLVSAEKPCWYPHDDVTTRKPHFTFVFTTTSGQEGFPCWRPSFDVL